MTSVAIRQQPLNSMIGGNASLVFECDDEISVAASEAQTFSSRTRRKARSVKRNSISDRSVTSLTSLVEECDVTLEDAVNGRGTGERRSSRRRGRKSVRSRKPSMHTENNSFMGSIAELSSMRNIAEDVEDAMKSASDTKKKYNGRTTGSNKLKHRSSTSIIDMKTVSKEIEIYEKRTARRESEIAQKASSHRPSFLSTCIASLYDEAETVVSVGDSSTFDGNKSSGNDSISLFGLDNSLDLSSKGGDSSFGDFDATATLGLMKFRNYFKGYLGSAPVVPKEEEIETKPELTTVEKADKISHDKRKFLILKDRLRERGVFTNSAAQGVLLVEELVDEVFSNKPFIRNRSGSKEAMNLSFRLTKTKSSNGMTWKSKLCYPKLSQDNELLAFDFIALKDDD